MGRASSSGSSSSPSVWSGSWPNGVPMEIHVVEVGRRSGKTQRMAREIVAEAGRAGVPINLVAGFTPTGVPITSVDLATAWQDGLNAAAALLADRGDLTRRDVDLVLGTVVNPFL